MTLTCVFCFSCIVVHIFICAMQDFVKSSNYPVLVISYEMFVRVYEDLTPVTFDLVICDEGHRLKNTAIKTTSVSETIPTQNI